ncbi:MAG: ATP-binding protein [Candidatus Paceibacterota bacterium]
MMEYVLIAILISILPVTFLVGLNVDFWLVLIVSLLQFIVGIIYIYFNKKNKDELNIKLNTLTGDRFLFLYERSPTPYLIINQSGKILMSNPAAISLFSATTDSLPEINFYERLHFVKEVDSEVIEGKINSGQTINGKELQIETLAGEMKWISMSVFRYEAEEQRLVSLIDITRAKLVDTAKTEFVALATHQLRTPISAIRWNFELLQKKFQNSITEEQQKYMGKIERNIFRMIALIDDFLNVSKLETGTFATDYRDINLTDFFDTIADEYLEKITEKNISLEKSYQLDNLNVRSDNRLLHIIVSNLLSNAVKYTKTNGKIYFSYKQQDGLVNITVADDGIGIPKGEIDKLFSKFYRASNARSHQTEGTGLGLYVVKQSIEKLKGDISVVSENGQTVFSVNLPLN